MDGDFMVIGWALLSKEEAGHLIRQAEKTYKEIENSLSKNEPKNDDLRNVRFFSFFDDLSAAENLIKSMFPVFIIIVVINQRKNKVFLYKGPDINEIKTTYLPEFFSSYEKFKLGKEPCLEKIEDLRALYANMPPKTFVN